MNHSAWKGPAPENPVPRKPVPGALVPTRTERPHAHQSPCFGGSDARLCTGASRTALAADRPACRARFSCGGSRPVKRPAGIDSVDFCGRGEGECGRFKPFGSRARRPTPPSSRDSARKAAGSPVHPARRRDRPPPRPGSPRRRCGWHRGNPQRRPFPPAPL